MPYVIHKKDDPQAVIHAGRQNDRCFEARVIDLTTQSGAPQIKVLYAVVDTHYVEGIDLELYDEVTQTWKKGAFAHTDNLGLVAVKCRKGVPEKSYEVKASILDGKPTESHSVVFTAHMTLNVNEMKFVPAGQDFATLNSNLKEVPLFVRLINTQPGGAGIKGVLVRISVSGALTFKNRSTVPFDQLTQDDGRLRFSIEPHPQDHLMMGTLTLEIVSSSFRQDFSIKLH